MFSVTTEDGSLTLWSERYQQTYGSLRGALREAQVVYLQPSGVSERFAHPGRRSDGSVRVLEIGFGTGLNFLVTADSAIKQRSPLEYVAVESRPLSAPCIAQLDYRKHLQCSSFYDSWLEGYGSNFLNEGHRLSVWDFEDFGVALKLHVVDATQFEFPGPGFDAIFLDAFSPKSNAELWTEEFLARLVGCLSPEGRLVTYSVAGSVRRSLTALGLTVKRIPGPRGWKRHTLTASRRCIVEE